ncbi:C40 family peptidase [Paenibacillus sp. 481]|uniref:C40 family peptidase n=1 Tax=Paenibacillus sp. 481 TaxID=2835869 RepID=UPI001E56DEBE|nr:SH3 domain-containing C40 family peptidase [Paenibacillus sp. 481]
MKKILLGLLMVSMTSQMIIAPTTNAAPQATNTNGQVAAATANSSQKGNIVAAVNFRDLPSMQGKVIRMLKKGEQVSILDKPSSAWYKVQDSKGQVGYVSTSSKYMSVSGNVTTPETPKEPTKPQPETNNNVNTNSSDKIEKIIATGKTYMGTPYEFGSNRNDTSTFDCSDFVRHIIREVTGTVIPADSRKQGAYVQNKGNAVTSLDQLKRGDLVFFMSYKGSKPASYAGINKSTERITHVGMYLGNGEIMHTYSQASGGVRIDKIGDNTWGYRFLYGGSAL